MAKKGKSKVIGDNGYVFGDIPLELQVLGQASVDQSKAVVESLEQRFSPLKFTNDEQVAIAKAIYEALGSAFNRAAKS